MSRRKLAVQLFVLAIAIYIGCNHDVITSSTLIKSFVTYCSQKFSHSSLYSIKIPNRRSEEKLAKKKKEIETHLVEKSPMVLNEVCSPNSDICYMIIDEAMRYKDELIVKRRIALKKMPNYALTIVDLNVPADLTWSNLNTRNWPVNKLVITTRYIKLLIAASFFTEALTFEPTEQQKVLMIGLGGGVASNFLSMLDWLMIHTTVVEIDPFIYNIARQFFDHTDDDRTNVIIDDGIQFLKTAVENEETYNALMIDACHTEDEDILCPIEEFYMKNDVIKNVADVLDENGVMTMNILCAKDSAENEDKILKAYEPFFPSCFLFKYLSQRRMLICSKKHNWTWTSRKSRFLKNIQQVDDVFEFKLYDLLKNI
ncbi:unnamed protein product [Auanema sp. JU1783]|nr:unnamed protein product [Auanema sp. JU1783]